MFIDLMMASTSHSYGSIDVFSSFPVSFKMQSNNISAILRRSSGSLKFWGDMFDMLHQLVLMSNPTRREIKEKR